MYEDHIQRMRETAEEVEGEHEKQIFGTPRFFETYRRLKRLEHCIDCMEAGFRP